MARFRAPIRAAVRRGADHSCACGVPCRAAPHRRHPKRQDLSQAGSELEAREAFARAVPSSARRLLAVGKFAAHRKSTQPLQHAANSWRRVVSGGYCPKEDWGRQQPSWPLNTSVTRILPAASWLAARTSASTHHSSTRALPCDASSPEPQSRPARRCEPPGLTELALALPWLWWSVNCIND